MSRNPTVSHQVMWSRLIPVVEEQAQATAVPRTVFSATPRGAKP